MTNELKGIAAVGVLLVFAAGFSLGMLQRAEPEVETVTEEVVVTEPVTPRSCTLALLAAEDIIGTTSRALEIAGKAVVASAKLDNEEVLRYTKVLTALRPDLKAPTKAYARLSTACREKAG